MHIHFLRKVPLNNIDHAKIKAFLVMLSYIGKEDAGKTNR